MEEPGELPSMGSHRVEHNWRDLAAAAEYIMGNTGLEEAQAGIKIAGRNIKNLRRKRGWQRMRRLDGMSLSELDGREFERTPEVGDG